MGCRLGFFNFFSQIEKEKTDKATNCDTNINTQNVSFKRFVYCNKFFKKIQSCERRIIWQFLKTLAKIQSNPLK
jgi:hypothetical protein